MEPVCGLAMPVAFKEWKSTRTFSYVLYLCVFCRYYFVNFKHVLIHVLTR